jgi:hypothetical protein
MTAARAIFTSLLVLLAAAAPAAARDLPSKEIVLTAYGAATTVCNVSVSMSRVYPNVFFPPFRFSGETTCTAPVRQSGQAWTELASGNLCSTFGMTCRSAGESMGGQTVRYRVTLTAPPGQGWIAPPDECTGAGTDKLACTFVAQLV